MHIPDGLMAPIILALGWIIAIIVLAFVTWFVNKRIDEHQIPLMAVLGAGIFVAQMLNFPIGGGTSGHLVGAALAAILLGPFVGMIVLTSILVTQCLLFGDGGITALGLNIINMAVIGCFVGYSVYKIFPEKYRSLGIFISSWLAVFLGAVACAIELATSYSLSNGIYGIQAYISIPVMLGFHAIIGFGEGIITTSILVYLAKISPEILKVQKIALKKQPEEVL